MNRDMSVPVVPTQSPTYGSQGGSNSNSMVLLPETFRPGEFDVICGRGKKAYNHVGNENFRKRVAAMLDEYKSARSKVDKSNVLNEVVEQVRAASGGGGFVKQDASTSRWYEVGDFLAREKTSQAFRDCLSDAYKSSSSAKKKKRQEVSKPPFTNYSKMAKAEQDIPQRPRQFNRPGNREVDQIIFNRGNLDLLTRIQRNQELGRSPLDLFNASDSNLNFGRPSHNDIRAELDLDYRGSGHRHQIQRGMDGPMKASSEIISRVRFAGREERYEQPRSRSYSLPSSPLTVPQGQDLEPELDIDDLHHSMPVMHYDHMQQRRQPQENNFDDHGPINALHMSLPNMNFNYEPRSRPNPMDMMNRSLPNIHFRDDGFPLEGGTPDEADLLEPLPFDSPFRSPARQNEFNRSIPRSLADQNFTLLDFEDSEHSGIMSISGPGSQHRQPARFENSPAKMAAPPSHSANDELFPEDFYAKLQKITDPKSTDSNPMEPDPIGERSDRSPYS